MNHLVRFVLGSILIAYAAPNARAIEAAPDRAGGNGVAALRVAVQEHGERLAALSSDEAALVLYRNELARVLDVGETAALLPSRPARRSRTSMVPPPDVTAPALHLVKELVRWETAVALRDAAEAGETRGLSALHRREQSRRAWLAPAVSHSALERALRLVPVIASLDQNPSSRDRLTSDHLDLAAYLDETYPSLAAGEQSWLALAERDGEAGVRRRLEEFWRREGRSDVSRDAVAFYFRSRLRPVFLAHLMAVSLRAEAEADRRATILWRRLRSWRDDWSTARGRARLCGTWLWTVHNHQNHQDRKMVMIFPPPDEAPPDLPLPKRIVVLGDGVYLRWEFPGGYQEDSLLLSAEDRRLEGTFTTSRGLQGTISGRRTAPCGVGPGARSTER